MVCEMENMVCEMENNDVEEMEAEVLSSMWPEDINEAGRLFNVEKPGADLDMLKEVNILEEPTIVDFKRLVELTNYSENGSSQLSYLVKNWEYKQANAVRLLREELDSLSKQRHEVELKQLEIVEQHRFEESFGGNKRQISVLDGVFDIWPDVPRRVHDEVVESKGEEVDAKDDTLLYWKQRTKHLEKLLEASIQREQILVEKLQDSIKNFETQSSPVEELSQILKRADNFLHFILQTAPVVIGHQDSELRYRFIYNHFPSLAEEEIIGKTDVEIFNGAGVKESQDFKREVLERGLPAKREITFETELFGLKTFLIYVEPVFSKAGDTIGVNYMGMDVTDQVRKREKMARLREEIAVQNAKETELNKTIHITEETMRAKQMLATMSHEIRSPLSGVVSMAEILSTTSLDKEQKQLLSVMLSSGDLVLQLINDILDLSKVESGVMKLEATKFRPREVVRHVLQTAAASLQKILTLEGHVADDVPIEVIGDVLRIRQILTNLISNAVKFTHEGKVGIKLYVIPAPTAEVGEGYDQLMIESSTTEEAKLQDGDRCSSLSKCCSDQKYFQGHKHDEEGPCSNHKLEDQPKTPRDGGGEENHHQLETTVWIRCDVYDTGIGIPEKALPTLFKKYMQAGADTQRKYGGTGLGLAICKQLVELMGGHLTVSSQEHKGSTFTFILPYKVSPAFDSSDDPDDDMLSCDAPSNDEDLCTGYFEFQPRTLGSLFSSNGSSRVKNLLPESLAFDPSDKLTRISEYPDSSPPSNIKLKERNSLEDDRVVEDGAKRLSILELSTTDIPESNKKIKVDNEPCVSSKPNGPSQDVSMACTHPLKAGNEEQEDARARKSREESDLQERINTNSQCSSSNGSEIPQPATKPKILLVEDNKINVMVTKSMMKQLGHTLTVVSNGIEAIQAIQCQRYDLVLMDVYMPEMNGLQATRIIRSFEETGNWDAAVEAGIEKPSTSSPSDQESRSSGTRIPIIAMTANSMSESAEECYANGMDSFVSKPVTFQKLKDCLEQFIK